MEPINWIKLLVLSTGVSIAMGIYLSSKIEFRSEKKYLPLFFLASLSVISLLSWIYHGHSLSQLWGVSGRATGLLSFLALIGACWLSHLAIRSDNLATILRMFLLCGFAVISYMSLQFFGIDIFEWSRLETFATLGNINFSSAFIGMWLCLITLLMLRIFRSKKTIATLFFLVIIWAIYVVVSSGSVQGIVGYFLASTFLVSFRILEKLKLNNLRWVVSGSIFILFSVFIFGTTQKTFLSGVLYQETMAFRRDYWVAALRMLKSSPAFGIGFDNYGLYYRSARDEIAATRTGILRVSDSAHSIFLDVSVSAGLAIALILFLLVALASINALNILSRKDNPETAYVSMIWLAYLPQLVVGINQLGIAVWAWIFLGQLLVIPELKQFRKDSKSVEDFFTRKKVVVTAKSNSGVQLSAKQFLTSIALGGSAFAIALPPFLADAQFYPAYRKGDLTSMISISSQKGSSQYLNERLLEFSSRGSDGNLVSQLAESVVERFPRSIYAWTTIYDLKVTPHDRRIEASEKIKILDPYLYDLEGLGND